MSNIWEFLLQTLCVSLTALLLLIVKYLLRDKLSPRWQYSVWGILALRILMPASIYRNVFLPISYWMETAKGILEGGLQSAYTDKYMPLSLKSPFPFLTAFPKSITDWLMVVYAAGVLLCLLRYGCSYLRLRLLLRSGIPSQEETQRLDLLCKQYGLRGCQALCVPGLPSAFVCGVFHPVLVLPADQQVDEKVLLHELLHLNYRDALQSTVWCLLRALHWCNPFLQYIFYRIGNDMESLCDQRVLERLDGEQRRQYGYILLSMANEQYAHAPGTTSISNGGKNISRRIAAIVRFKAYPRGMTTVSVCMALLLMVPTLFGSASAYSADQYLPVTVRRLDAAMALARIDRCETVAGALDTFAKGLLWENGIYIAMASPFSEHPVLEERMRAHSEQEGWVAYHLDAGRWLDYPDRGAGYEIYNLTANQDGSLNAVLGFTVTAFRNPDGTGWMKDENDDVISGSVLVPVCVSYCEEGWTVKENGERVRLNEPLRNVVDTDEGLPLLTEFSAEGRTGRITSKIFVVYQVGTTNSESSDASLPLSDAEFDHAIIWNISEYNISSGTTEEKPAASVGFQIGELNAEDEKFSFPSIVMAGSGGGSSTDGYDWVNEVIEEDWNGCIRSGSGSYCYKFSADIPVLLPAGFHARVYWDGKLVEELFLKEEAG